MFDDLYSYSNLPTLDLHGEIGCAASIFINDFVKDNIKLKNKYIAIVHGIGTGKLKKVTFDTLKNNKNVLEYKLCIFNEGMTIAKLKL